MPGISKRAFDFDKWKELAETNPEAFEFNRQRIPAVLTKVPEPDQVGFYWNLRFCEGLQITFVPSFSACQVLWTADRPDTLIT